MEKLTKEQAIALHDAQFWEPMTHRQRAEFQLRAELLCMPFGVFHEAVEKSLGRPVFTHEFGLNWDGLRRELAGEQSPPTMAQVLELIPADKRVIIVSGNTTPTGGDE